MDDFKTVEWRDRDKLKNTIEPDSEFPWLFRWYVHNPWNGTTSDFGTLGHRAVDGIRVLVEERDDLLNAWYDAERVPKD